MKVLLISARPKNLNGGIAVWTEQYLSQSSIHGIECQLVNTEAIGKRAEQGTAKRSLKDEYVRTKRIFSQLNGILGKNNEFDVAHINTSCGTFGLFRDYLIARRIQKKGIPVITHYHCDIPFWIHNPISKKILGQLAKRSAQNLVLCENSSQYLLEQFGLKSIKMPNFIEENMILQNQKHIEENIQRIFFVGRVEEAKGVAEIYELAKRLPDITFDLVGAVSDTVAQWDRPENVKLLRGMPHDQVIAHMDKADLFLLPSHSEGFSLALAESMARGVPAIATNVGAASDMLGDGCGIVVEKGDVDAMEQAIRKLQSAHVREELSRCAIAKVKNEYTISAVMTRLRKTYEDLS